ncbi:MAG: zinc-ribbon domain-containing protein [Ruminococcaceae bacterium]|nr:zinc-ribbon domain-containing protein [Oscillospiraceae bacterium]
MKVCPKCNSQLDDSILFCPNCGAAQNAQQQQHQQPYTPYVDPNDRTAEFDAKDISENKVIAMAPYLLGWIGIVVALLAAGQSKFASFHVRQALKIEIVSALLGLCAAVLVWTFIVPAAAGIAAIVLLVVKIICFFNVCSGKAKEAPIVSSLKFLK